MKLLFFIRTIDLTRRTFTFEEDRVGELHELIFCRNGRGTLRASAGDGGRTDGYNAAGARGSAAGARDSTGGAEHENIAEGHLLFNPTGRLTGFSDGLSVTQVLFSEELFSPSVAMDKEALYVLGLIKVHARTRNSIALSNIGTERMVSLLDAMSWEFQNRYRGYSWAIRLKLVELLITVMRDPRFNIAIRGLKPLSNTRIQDAVLYVNAEFMNPISVEDVLEACALSRSHFHALFKQETGRTFVDYLNMLRSEKAGDMLATSDAEIIDIAGQCGFNNLSHFYHVFRRHTGYSPKQYRETVSGRQSVGL
ncbi:MAG: helix-turn-helix transcriptional regulator [Spirochaetales bacterium]